jgi:hypothetical protein
MGGGGGGGAGGGGGRRRTGGGIREGSGRDGHLGVGRRERGSSKGGVGIALEVAW